MRRRRLRWRSWPWWRRGPTRGERRRHVHVCGWRNRRRPSAAIRTASPWLYGQISASPDDTQRPPTGCGVGSAALARRPRWEGGQQGRSTQPPPKLPSTSVCPSPLPPRTAFNAQICMPRRCTRRGRVCKPPPPDAPATFDWWIPLIGYRVMRLWRRATVSHAHLHHTKRTRWFAREELHSALMSLDCKHCQAYRVTSGPLADSTWPQRVRFQLHFAASHTCESCMHV